MNYPAQKQTLEAPPAPSARRLGAAVALAVLLAGAGASPPARAAGEQARPDAAVREEVDGAGRHVRVPARPARVVSLAPSLTEIFSAIGAWDLLAGISDYGRVPEGLDEPARVGGLIHPDMERIVSLKPDLVFATTSGNYQEDADQIERLGIPVYTLDTPTVESVLGGIETIGRIVGRQAPASALVRELRSRLEAVRKRVAGAPKPAVLFVIWDKPIIAPGRNAFVTEALSLSGARSVSEDLPGKWPEMDLEQIIARRPEVILTVPHQRAMAEALSARPEWAVIPAVRERRIHVVSDDIQQPGPRIVDGIEEVARLLHPERPE